MWLLRFHAAFSILCALATFGFLWIFHEALVENGLLGKKNTAKLNYVKCTVANFIPLVNVVLPFLVLYMATHKVPEKQNDDPAT